MSHPPAMQEFLHCLTQGCQALGLSLTPEQIRLMGLHAQELFNWNGKINLTAIKGSKAVAEKHFVDAVAVSPLVPSGIRIMDLGSGGGFPGLPLKTMIPDLDLTLVDASRKKINFLKHVIRTQKAEHARAIHSRVEELHTDPGHAGQYDGVISRGFANLDKFIDLAQPLLKPDGVFYALKGENASAEVSPELEERFLIKTDFYKLPFEKADRYLIRLYPKA
ncbi:MAG: 16S rRNA (guanine(527)-N(7))-methyltransferase RsmG [Desulfobacterales bacterium]|nr:16S rRNA (guanine(527)-N(7))-methyltransferase RsmG [Desulfobacterales bacterium]